MKITAETNAMAQEKLFALYDEAEAHGYDTWDIENLKGFSKFNSVHYMLAITEAYGAQQKWAWESLSQKWQLTNEEAQKMLKEAE